MHKNYLILILMTIFLFACQEDDPVIVPPPDPSDTLGTIIGSVTDLSSNGINGVQITLQYNGNYYSGFSDTTGQYAITGVPAGNHFVYTYKNGYKSDTLNLTLNQGDTAQADFQLQQTYWYRLNANSNYLSGARAYYNLYINPQQVIFASTRPGSWIAYNLEGFIKTTNLGANWENVIYNGSSSEIYTISDNNLFIFTAKGQNGSGNYIGENKLYRSIDFGGSWQELLDLNLEQIDGYKLVGMNSGTLFLSMHGWRNSSQYFYFYKSINQGSAWNSYSPLSQYNVRGLNKTSSGKIYIASYGDSIYYSTNGSDWTLRIVNTTIRNYVMNSVVLPTGEMIASTSSNYNISYDDGENWSPRSTNLSYFPQAAKFKYNSNNEILGIVNNESNNAFGVYKSTDKCQTWALIDDGLPQMYRPVSMEIFQDFGFLLLEDGYLYKTSKKTTETMSDRKTKRLFSR